MTTIVVTLTVIDPVCDAAIAAEDLADIARVIQAYRDDGLSFRFDQAYFDAGGGAIPNLCVPVENAAGWTPAELREFFRP